jgi:hypothetical protein
MFFFVMMMKVKKGEMAEWFKAQHWKCCLEETLTRVRIPLSPNIKTRNKKNTILKENLFF